MTTRTPSRPAHPARCDGLLVQLASGGSKAASAARLRKIVRECLKGKWQVRLINHSDRLYELMRMRPACQPTNRQAFDMLRELDAHPAISLCEIGAIVPGADPRLTQVHTPARSKSIAQGLGTQTHKDCSRREDWALSDTNVQAAWALPTPRGGRPQGAGIVIAHPDTGYTRHPEFTQDGRVLIDRGYDFEDEKRDPKDPLKGLAPGHGTATGSVMMSAPGDQTPQVPHFVTGVAPRARLIPIRVATGVVHLSFRRLVRAVYYAIEQNAHIISLSLGGPFYSVALQIAVQSAVGRGIIVIAAAGNVWPFVVYPAKFDPVLAVAASNCVRKPWGQSAGGRSVDIAAPGESVWRAKASKRAATAFSSARSNGTSYSTAIVAGACALWLGYHGRTKLQQKYGKENLSAAFRYLLRQTAAKPGGWQADRYGRGIINVEGLLTEKLPARRTVASRKPSPEPASALTELLELCPDASDAQVRNVLARTWRCKTRELENELKPYEQELRYLMATNPELREEIVKRARAKRISGISSTTLAKPELLGRKTSRGLARRLGL